MKLATRLSLAASGVVLATSFGISYTALNTAEESEISRLDTQLAKAVAAAVDSKDPLSAISNVAEQSNPAMSVAFLSNSNDITLVSEADVRFQQIPDAALVAKALSQAITISNSEVYRIRSFQYAEDEYILVASNIASVIENKGRNTSLFFGFTAVGVMAGALLLWILIRRDTRVIESLIAQAERIASGDSSMHTLSPSGSDEFRQLMDALNRMMLKLRENQETMRDFLGDSSHELRTPLTVIRGYVELLQSDIDEESQLRAFARLDSEIRRMESLISELLFLAEASQDTEMANVSVNLSHLVDAAVNDLLLLDNQRQVTHSVEQDICVEGDEKLVQKLLSNLVGNIRRHTPAAANVNIELHRKDDRKVQLIVEDGGPGLPSEMYERGIQAFQRFDKSRSRQTGGTGLGMSIMAAIVKRHQGEMRLSPSPLGGLRIEILFHSN